jgi:hypothetical protein
MPLGFCRDIQFPHLCLFSTRATVAAVPALFLFRVEEHWRATIGLETGLPVSDISWFLPVRRGKFRDNSPNQIATTSRLTLPLAYSLIAPSLVT